MKYKDLRESQFYCDREQTHVHEVVGSVRLAELGEDPHNHRFAGVTDEVIFVVGGRPGEHYHKLTTKTDFYENHFHPICIKTGLMLLLEKGMMHVMFTLLMLKQELRTGIFMNLLRQL